MDDNNTLDIVVIKYLDNEMSPEEKITFEERLYTDPQLNSRLERFRRYTGRDDCAWSAMYHAS